MNLCLNMIVRNEAHVIARAIDSALPFIQSWAIVDTGSTDGTQEIIRAKLGHLPGTLVESPWVDFATNRNQALGLAIDNYQAEYVLTLDADDYLEIDEGPWSMPRDASGYRLEIVYGDTRYWRTAIVAPAVFEWRGVVHEALYETSAGATIRNLPGLRIVCGSDGARSLDPTRCLRDADALYRTFATDPNNTRNWFYYAQSLADAGWSHSAISAYEQRIKLGGWDEEIYISKLRIAKLEELTGADPARVLAAYLAAHEFRPSRAEALYELARWLRLQKRFALAAMFASRAYDILSTDDLLFVDRSVYSWRAADELAVSSYHSGNYQTCESLCLTLLRNDRVPASDRPRVERNLEHARRALWKLR